MVRAAINHSSCRYAGAGWCFHFLQKDGKNSACKLQLGPGKLADGRHGRGLIQLQHFAPVWRE